MVDEHGAAAALQDVDDAFLVSRAREGDLRAFTALLRRHNHSLQRYVGRLTRNPADTDDVLQDTALLAWQHLDRIREPYKVRAWLIQVATREALRHINDRQLSDELTEELVQVAGPDHDLEHLDLRRSLQNALDALPQQQAQCWILRELGGYPYREIAAELALPESTVRGALAQARKTIIRAIGGAR